MTPSIAPGDRQERIQVGNNRLRGCLLIAGAMCLLIPLFAAIRYGWDALVDAPWAYTVWQRQTLTGTWEAKFTAQGPQRFAVLMDLQRARLPNGQPQDTEEQGPLLSGTENWCDNQGRHAERIAISGAVPAFSGYNGTIGDVQLSLEAAAPQIVGLQPGSFKGAWNLDTLTVQPTFQNWTGTAFVYSSGDAQPVVFHKSDENAYRAACAALGTNVP